MQVKLTLEDAEGLKEYLMGRPFREVAYGVQILQQAIDEAKQRELNAKP